MNERTFAYELYRQWQDAIVENEEGLIVNAEVTKRVEDEKFLDKLSEIFGLTKDGKPHRCFYPDLVFHHSQYDSEKQEIICEIKTKDGIDEKDIDRGVLDIGVFVQTAPFLVKMKLFGGNDEAYKRYKRLEKTELAVFDDIAAVKMSSYDYNILYALIETRVFSHLPSIFTSNITSESEMRTILGPSLAVRVWNNSVAIELKGHGYRFR
jgi:hypothetical protein